MVRGSLISIEASLKQQEMLREARQSRRATQARRARSGRSILRTLHLSR